MLSGGLICYYAVLMVSTTMHIQRYLFIDCFHAFCMQCICIWTFTAQRFYLVNDIWLKPKASIPWLCHSWDTANKQNAMVEWNKCKTTVSEMLFHLIYVNNERERRIKSIPIYFRFTYRINGCVSTFEANLRVV